MAMESSPRFLAWSKSQTHTRWADGVPMGPGDLRGDLDTGTDGPGATLRIRACGLYVADVAESQSDQYAFSRLRGTGDTNSWSFV